MTRIVLSTLRQAAGPLTTRLLALAVTAERGLNTADPAKVRLFARRIGATLRHHRDPEVAAAD